MSGLTFGFTAQEVVDEGRTTWEDINLIKSWLKMENLPKLTDEQIVYFLLSCDNKQEPTKTTIKAHFNLKNRCPEIFHDRHLKREDLQKQLNTLELCFIPQKTDDGCTVTIGKLRDTYYKNVDQGPLMKLLYMMLEAAMHSHPPTGFIVILDLKGIGLMHLTRIRVGLIKPFVDYLQQGLPVKLKQIHVLNTLYFMDKIMYIVKPFLNKHTLDLMKFHPGDMDMNDFHDQWIPKKCLPEDYGGDLPPLRILHQRNIETMKNLQGYFEEEELQRRNIDWIN